MKAYYDPWFVTLLLWSLLLGIPGREDSKKGGMDE